MTMMKSEAPPKYVWMAIDGSGEFTGHIFSSLSNGIDWKKKMVQSKGKFYYSYRFRRMLVDPEVR